MCACWWSKTLWSGTKLLTPVGFEPTIPRLEGECLIH